MARVEDRRRTIGQVAGHEINLEIEGVQEIKKGNNVDHIAT